MSRVITILIALLLFLPSIGQAQGGGGASLVMAGGEDAVAGGCAGDANCISFFEFENDNQDSKGTNHLDDTATNSYDNVTPLKGSYSAYFDVTSNEYAQCDDGNLSADFPGASATTTAFTICTHVEFDSLAGDDKTMASVYDVTANDRSWRMQAETGGPNFKATLGHNNGSSYIDYDHATETVATGTHYFVCFSYCETGAGCVDAHSDDLAIRVRLPDSACATLGADFTDDSALDANVWEEDAGQDFIAGKYVGATEGEMAGELDELYVFTRELTAQEVTDLCNEVF